MSTNSDVITRALDALIRSEGCESSHAAPAPRTPEDDSDSHYFVSTGSSLVNLLDLMYNHSEHCAQRLTCRHDKTFMVGTVAVYSLQCSYGHCVSWTSSPYLPKCTHHSVRAYFLAKSTDFRVGWDSIRNNVKMRRNSFPICTGCPR